MQETEEKVTHPQNQSKEGPSQERTDFDMKQFEVESIGNFVQNVSKDPATEDRVQYVSSLKSVEVRNALNFDEEKEGSESIEITDPFGPAKDNVDDGPSSKFL